MDTLENYRVSFIIAHKYFRGYESHLKYYIEQIFNLYNNAFIVVVDNNSTFKSEIFDTLPNNNNIVLLDNNIDCKFELGAYQVGIKYMIDNNLIHLFDYYVFTQDNFILKNKYNFNNLFDHNINACQINSWKNDWAKMDVCEPILKNIGLFNKLDESKLCWCNSFITSKKVVNKLYEYLTKIVITTRHQSEGSERYLGRILLELNDGHPTIDIDGDIGELIKKYDCWNVTPRNEINSYFIKVVQQKNERTIDK